MYRVYEVFKADRNCFIRYESHSKEDCESWIERHEDRELSVKAGLSELLITEKGVCV